MSEALKIDGRSLSIDDVMQVCTGGRQVELAETAQSAIQRAREVVDKVLARRQVVYGINTGFGFLKNTVIGEEQLSELQHNLILSHACGVGDPLPEEVVRAIMLLRANTLVQGFSGAREVLIQLLLDCLNAGIHPLIPAQGSVGASGDLAPLAHLGLTLLGEGQVHYQGRLQPAAEALAAAGLQPARLEAKEGLALINGTQPMSALACFVVRGLRELLDIADAVASLSIQVGLGSREAFRPELHALRPHPGQIQSAHNLWHFMADSPLISSHRDCDRIQDAYSFRCVPQVHGASRDSLSHIEAVIAREINAVTDNPIILPDSDEVISCGHFHGQPVALAMDAAKLALSELANISERRIERLVNPQLNQGLPAFLTRHGGLHSGLMISQYAAAALVSENKVLVHPASADSIPTSANQEDHVSMGTIAARQAQQILQHSRQVLAIELLCACQALDLSRPLKTSALGEALHACVRSRVAELDGDRYLAPDQAAIFDLIAQGELHQVIQPFLSRPAGAPS